MHLCGRFSISVELGAKNKAGFGCRMWRFGKQTAKPDPEPVESGSRICVQLSLPVAIEFSGHLGRCGILAQSGILLARYGSLGGRRVVEWVETQGVQPS